MRRPFLICVLTALLGISFLTADAQPLRRLNNFSYNINDGLLQSSIVDMNFDGVGFMWLSYETGLQRYDGHNFSIVLPQKGLPDNQNIKFLKSKNGGLWLCHSKGVSYYNPMTNHFTLILSFKTKNSLPAIWPVNEDGEAVYFYSADGYIIGISETTFQVVKRNRFPFSTHRDEEPAEFQTAGSPSGHEVLICFNRSILVRWNLEKDMPTQICRLPAGREIAGQDFHPLSGKSCFFFSKNKLTIYDLFTNSFSCLTKNILNRQNIEESCYEGTSQPLILMSVNNELFQFNTTTMQPVAKLVNFQNQPFAHFPIRYIRSDNFGNIYLVTRNEGFVKLLADTYPISYYGSSQKRFNFITTLEVDKKNNRILAGSLNSGLLVFDTLQQLQKHVAQIGKMQQPGPLTIVGIIHIKDDKYLLFPRFNSSCVLWDAATGKLKMIPIQYLAVSGPDSGIQISRSIAYYNAKITLNKNAALIAIDENLFKVTFSNVPSVKAFSCTHRIKGLCLYQEYILSGTDENLCFRDTSNYSIKKEVALNGCGEIRCITTYNNMIYVGCNRGLFILNAEGKIISSFSKQNGLPDDYIYGMEIDKQGNLWCSTNKGIVGIGRGSSIIHLRKEDGLQENEFNTNVAAKEGNGELFFGGVNGINSFYPDQINNIDDSPKVVLTNIRVNDEDFFKDSATWVMKNVFLPYNRNNLYFEFTALGKRNPEQYLYQYKMLGIDKTWVRSSEAANARYLLQPGKYVFQIYAGDPYNDHPKDIQTIAIMISPPWWQTWWFRILIIAGFAGIIVLVVRQYLNRKYQKKLRALQLQHEIQNERDRISRDLHDNIGAQLSFISSNIDWVIDKNKDLDKEEELRQMKAINAAAKSVMTNLRETIWALHKEEITLQEFSDKLKAYVQNILQLQSGLEFISEEKIARNFVLTPTEMLNIFRICQECINNVLKHAKATLLKIMIYSDDNSFHIVMEDNGKGFDLAQMADGHYGLINMKHRAEELNAKLMIASKEGKGTIVEIHK
jgi:signal transduction histidine kinase